MSSAASIVEAVVTDSVSLMVPVLWAASGEAVGEQAGVLNVGIEGVMLLGAFLAAAAFRVTGSLWAGWALSLPLGVACGVLLWFLYVYRGCNQIVTGLLFNLFALGVTTALYERYLTGAGIVLTIPNWNIPGLGSIPGVGPAVFQQSPLFYLAVLACIVLWYVLWHSWFGLSLRAAGEKPQVAAAAGLSVLKLRLLATVVACTLAALGGAALTMIATGTFTVDMTSGEGFIALAIVILGRWNPLWIIVGAWLFGLADALQFQLTTVSALAGVPHDVWLSVPYLVTIAVVVWARGARYPEGTGAPWEPPHRRRFRLVPAWWR